jgi:hypothetical protein
MSEKENDNLAPDEGEGEEYRFLSEQIRSKPVNKVRLFKRTFLIGAVQRSLRSLPALPFWLRTDHQ